MVEKTKLSMSASHHATHRIPGDSTLVDRQSDKRLGSGADQSWLCAGCGTRITDRYYLLVADRQWHGPCLKCCECKLRLDSELTCFARDGNIYCKEDYYRRFAVRQCARCNLGISANELVMRVRDLVYHLACFTCQGCNRLLTKGDQFGMKGRLVYCRSDYELLYQEGFGEFVPLGLGDGDGGRSGGCSRPQEKWTPSFNGVRSVTKVRSRKRKNSCMETGSCTHSLGVGAPSDSVDRPTDPLDRDAYQAPPRQKRMRTSFKHHQLRTLKSYFALNHNPDTKDLKQLSQKTGLPKRVLQVWFQNARAKYRRSLLKEDQEKVPQQQQQLQRHQAAVMEQICDSQSMSDLGRSKSPALSELSSAPSLSDLQNGSSDPDTPGRSGLGDLFTNSIPPIKC